MTDHLSIFKTILVVEDDKSIRDILQEALEAEGYHVVTAVNGLDGLEKINQVPKPCLVLLDMLMPVMNGREFLDAVLASATLAPIPVVVVSATATQESSMGAADFIKKPIDLEVLLQLVEQYSNN